MEETQVEIIEPTNDFALLKKKLKKRRPTQRQIKFLHYKKQGLSTRQALLKAGYSVNVANKGNRFFNQQGLQNHLSTLITHLESVGLTEQKFANKIKEFVDADKQVITAFGPLRDKDGKEIRVVDRKTQLEGVKLWSDLLKENKKETEGVGKKVKREMRITEYINNA